MGIKLANADRFGDVCVTADEESTKSPEITMISQEDIDMTEPIQVHCNDNSSDSKYSTMVWVLVAILFLIIVAQFAFMYTNTPKQASVKEIEMPDFTGSPGHGGAHFDVESK